jgi:hypothetical protein
VIARYFGKFDPARQDKPGNRLLPSQVRLAPIVRHRMVAGTASPDDPGLSEYLAQRRRRSRPPVGATALRLLRVQHGRCPLCRGLLLLADHEPQSPREWEQWLTATCTAIRKHAVAVWRAGTPDERVARLIHAHCAVESPAAATDQHCPPHAGLQGLLEPVAWKAGTAGSEGAPGAAMRRGYSTSASSPLGYFTLAGSDYPSHAAQETAIARYVRWANRRATPKRHYAINSKIHRPDYLPKLA